MIRIPVNLASEPFRKTRAALVGYVSAAVLLSILLLVQVVYIVRQHNQASDLRSTKNSLTRQLAAIDQQQGQINITLRQPQNSAVLEESVFLNALIERKAISWTRLFSDLSQVMPANVRLISVRLPQIDSRNRVQLDMVVGSTEPGPIVELLKKLEASAAFGSTSVMSSMPPGQNEQLYRYRVTVSYAQKL
jgi:type IV pilus assembly protein PilN